MPDIPIPDPPDPISNPAAYLRSIHAVRERTKLVLEEAKVNALNHFESTCRSSRTLPIMSFPLSGKWKEIVNHV